MHELFANVLAKRDLSRAGDLFGIDDEEIENGLTDVVSFSRFIAHVWMDLSTVFLFPVTRDFYDYFAATLLGNYQRSIGY